MYNLHPRKFHFQGNVRGHLSSNFQVTWANRTKSTDRRRGATSTATVNTGGSTASTVLITTLTEMTQGTRRTQRTSADWLKGIEDKKWEVNYIILKHWLEFTLKEDNVEKLTIEESLRNWKMQVILHLLALFYLVICKLRANEERIVCNVEKTLLSSLFKSRPHNFIPDSITDEWWTSFHIFEFQHSKLKY